YRAASVSRQTRLPDLDDPGRQFACVNSSQVPTLASSQASDSTRVKPSARRGRSELSANLPTQESGRVDIDIGDASANRGDDLCKLRRGDTLSCRPDYVRLRQQAGDRSGLHAG